MASVPGQKLKIVFARPGDSDPPSDPVWVVDDIPGIQPPPLLIKDLLTPCDSQFGAVGDGVTDDTAAMQAWLDAIAGRAGFGCAGVFGVSSTLFIDANTTIYGCGQGSFQILKLSGFPSGSPLLKNRHEVLYPSPQVDTNINIYGTAFSGRSGDIVSAELLSFEGVASLCIRNCLLRHNRSYLLAASNCANAVIDQNEFYDWGVLGVGGGGQAIWFNNQNTDIQITNNDIHDGQWMGILCDAIHAVVTGNRVRSVKEVGINGSPSRSVINNNVVASVRRRVSNGHGIALGGFSNTCVGNTVFDTDDASIYLANVSVVNCSGNVCNLPNEFGAPTVGSVGAITLVVTIANGVENVCIANNNCSGRDGKGTYGIACYNFGGSTMTNVSITNNQLGIAEGWLGAPIYVGPNVRGLNWVQRGNDISVDTDSCNVAFRIDSGTAAGSLLTIGSVGFQPRTITFSATTSSGVTAPGSSGWAMQESVWDIAAQLGTTKVFQSDANFWSADAGGFVSGNKGGQFCVYLAEGDGTPICGAGIIGLTDDGFILRIDPDNATTQDVFVTATCSP